MTGADTTTALGEGDALPQLYRSGRAKRQRARARRVAAYAAGILAITLFAVTANWERLGDKFFNTDIAREMFPDVVEVAAKNTVVYTAAAFTGGVALGITMALLRLSSIRPYRWFAAVFIEIFRGLPALLTIFLVGFMAPIALDFKWPTYWGVPVGGIVALALVAAAYLAETVRAGMEAVPKGQVEAARSLGFTHAQTLRRIVIPQAFRIVLPPLTNEFVLLLKDTSLLSTLGFFITQKELTKFGRDVANTTANATPLVVVGLMYLVITIPLTQLVAWLERRNKRSR